MNAYERAWGGRKSPSWYVEKDIVPTSESRIDSAVSDAAEGLNLFAQGGIFDAETPLDSTGEYDPIVSQEWVNPSGILENSERGHMNDLVPVRNKYISDKPLVAAFTNDERWMRTNIERGWQIKKYGIDERLLELIPNDVLGNLNSSYPKGNWGIRETGHIAKSWWFIIKGY